MHNPPQHHHHGQVPTGTLRPCTCSRVAWHAHGHALTSSSRARGHPFAHLRPPKPSRKTSSRWGGCSSGTSCMAAAASSSTTVVLQQRLCLTQARRFSHEDGLSTEAPSMAAPGGAGELPGQGVGGRRPCEDRRALRLCLGGGLLLQHQAMGATGGSSPHKASPGPRITPWRSRVARHRNISGSLLFFFSF